MLSLSGPRRVLCDGVSRRDFFRIGGAVAGLTLAEHLRLDALAGSSVRPKSIINIYLTGGPSHLDTFDLKPGTPKEYRGEFQPIATKVAGFEICEHLPKLASHTDKIAVIRSVTGMSNEHAPTQSDSGWPQNDLKNQGGRPGLGPVMSRLMGDVQNTEHGAAPTAVDMTGWTKPGFLGPIHAAFKPDGVGRQNLTRHAKLTEARFAERQDLLDGLDRFREEIDNSGRMQALDSFSERAVDIVTSGRIAEALNLKSEPVDRQERYGIKKERSNERFLLARRLIEAGVRHVSFAWGSWDTHGQNFKTLATQLPKLDMGLTSLIEDLSERGLLEDTIIMMSGEFGRTPRINGNAGRDHWPQGAFFFLAGGGLKTGQFIGSTNRLGERPDNRPVHLQEIFATIYHLLGIDTHSIQLADRNGRPQYLLDHRGLIGELV